MRRSDFLVRDRIQATRNRLDDLARRFADLEDPDFLLRASQGKISRMISDYEDGLIEAVAPIFTGRDLDRLTAEATRDAAKELRKYVDVKTVLGKSFEKRIAQALRNDYQGTIEDRMRQVTRNLRSKVSLYRSMVNSAKIPGELVEESFTRTQIIQMRTDAIKRAERLIPKGATEMQKQRILRSELDKVNTAIRDFDKRGIVTVGGREYTRANLTESFQRASQRYGRHDTVIFGNGTKFPLRTYVDTRLRTMTREVRNTTTSMAAASTGTMTVKFSSHGSSDSCQFWEGKIAFINDQAKSEFMRRFPDDPRVSRIPTVQQVDADSTHMLGHGCLHTYGVFPIQFFDESDRLESLEAGQPPELPAKIQEHKIIAATRERRGIAA